jgi:hypothetical protein
MSNRSTTAMQKLDEWGMTASDRDIQLQLLRVAVETREKVETIRNIITFLFALWLVGVLVVLVAIATESAT